MQALSTLFLLSLLPFTLGQGYGTPQDTSSSTAAATSPAGSIQTVTVGENGLSFSPNSITAAVGSIIEFHFFAPAHAVAQSSFSSPCAPLSGGTGFFSGTITTSSGQNSNVFRITINDTNAAWIYCTVPTHCESGMVGVINPPNDATQTLELYKAAAAKVASTVAPPIVQGGVIGPASSSTSAAATPSSTAKNGAESTLGRIYWVGILFTAVLAVGTGMSIV